MFEFLRSRSGDGSPAKAPGDPVETFRSEADIPPRVDNPVSPLDKAQLFDKKSEIDVAGQAEKRLSTMYERVHAERIDAKYRTPEDASDATLKQLAALKGELARERASKLSMVHSSIFQGRDELPQSYDDIDGLTDADLRYATTIADEVFDRKKRICNSFGHEIQNAYFHELRAQEPAEISDERFDEINAQARAKFNDAWERCNEEERRNFSLPGWLAESLGIHSTGS